MSQNSPDTYKADERIIDLTDLFLEILRSWKFILLLVILITVLFNGFFAFRKLRTNKADSKSLNEIEENLKKEHEKKLTAALNKLTSAQAKEVEDINDQYQLYMDHRAQYQKDFAGNLKASEKLENDLVVKRVSYVFSSSIEFAETLMTNSLTTDDYKAIKKLLPEVKDLTTASNYVNILSNTASRTQIMNFGPQEESTLPTTSLIVFEVVGKDKDVCDQLDKIVDKALQRKKKKLQAFDNDILFSRIDETYRGNVLEYIAQKRQASLDYIQKIDQALSNFKVYTIDKLSPEQKEYLNNLKDPEYGLDLNKIHTAESYSSGNDGKTGNLFSVKKIIIGIFLGLIISVGWIFFRYLIDRTIKVCSEIEEYYHIPVLNTYFMGGHKKGVVNKLVRKFINADDKGVEEKTKLIAVDICGIMKNINTDSLYIIRTTESMEDRAISKAIMKAATEKASDFQLTSGIPFLNENELDKITKYQNALILVHTKESMRSEMEKILALCQRHSIEVMGAVAIVDC